MHKFCFSLQVFRLNFLSLFAKSTVRFFGFRQNFSGYATVICPCEPVFSVNSLGHITVTPSSIAMLGTASNGLSSTEADGKLVSASRLLKPLLFIKFCLRIKNYFHRFFSSCDKSNFTEHFAPIIGNFCRR